MKYLYLLVTILLLVLFDFYLKTNISGINQGSLHLTALIFVFVVGGGLIVWRGIVSNGVALKTSTFLLIAFIVYFITKMAIDVGSTEKIISYTLATSGGIVLFYALGLIIALVLGQFFVYVSRSKAYLVPLTWALALYITVSFRFLVSVYLELSLRLRDDIFLISDLDGAYQRPGNFLIISFLVLTTFYVQIMALNQNSRSRVYRLCSPVFFVAYIAYALLSMITAQMIGSNNATVVIAGLSLVLLVIFVLVMSRKVKYYLATQYLNIRKVLLGTIGRRLVFIGVSSVIFLIIIAVALGLDISSTRLGGFGSGEISSISARLHLLKNFAIQFGFSPIFGNMQVDTLTTGTGSYIHSFLASILTHLGLIGFVFMVGYLILIYKERFKSIQYNFSQKEDLLGENIFNLYSILAFSVVLLIASVGTFFTWATIWFAMGLLMGGVRFKSNKRVNNEF